MSEMTNEEAVARAARWQELSDDEVKPAIKLLADQAVEAAAEFDAGTVTKTFAGVNGDRILSVCDVSGEGLWFGVWIEMHGDRADVTWIAREPS